MPKYSQNFLRNGNIADAIAKACDVLRCPQTVEIGPGKGFLTRRILPGREGSFTAVEIDPEMYGILKKEFPDGSKIHLINSDFLELDLEKDLPQGDILFVGNLPYAVGAPILQKVLAFGGFKNAVFMFQKEVGDRLAAKPGGAEYGLLALSAQSRAKVRRLLNVGRGSFLPPPKVESSVIVFERLPAPLFESQAHQDKFFKLINAAFRHRRKTLANSLALSLDWERSTAEKLLQGGGVDPQSRAQELPLETYLSLAKVF
ncbi:MAG TPA: 16S rRNA (adenine(1518)-N(6)/adenine(1519)-N(6))-dimethyltransferase RsmA [Elusimicrobiales bacterium]|nr:16S rRNA (adenine(1518)-N(6)/adenine(1519)-N(6))-dimethyltransferase RsmA [Elusimicrobiales bacterium]